MLLKNPKGIRKKVNKLVGKGAKVDAVFQSGASISKTTRGALKRLLASDDVALVEEVCENEAFEVRPRQKILRKQLLTNILIGHVNFLSN